MPSGLTARRYLFLSAGYLVQLAPDGLSIVGDEKKIYDGWQYPKDWVGRRRSRRKGRRFSRRGDYYYQVLAQGGTAGPPPGT